LRTWEEYLLHTINNISVQNIIGRIKIREYTDELKLKIIFNYNMCYHD